MKKLSLLVIFFFANAVLAQDACKEVLVLGFLTKTNIHQTGDTTRDVLDWLRSDSFKEYNRSNSGGFGLNIPIKGINIGFNANTDDSMYQMLKDSLDKGNSSYYNNTFVNDVMSQVVDSKVVSAWENCMLSKDQKEAGGLIGIVDGEMGNNVFLRLKWQPRMNVNSAKVADITITGADYNNKILKSGDSLGTEWKTLLLTRNKDSELSIVVNLENNLGSYSKSLPKIAIPEIPLKELCLAGDLTAFQRIDMLSKSLEKRLPNNTVLGKTPEELRRMSPVLSAIDDLVFAVGRLIENKTAYGEKSKKVSDTKEFINDVFDNMDALKIKY